MKTPSAKFLKQRKFFLALPVLVAPFLTLTCWALGLGSVAMEAPQQKTGLNTGLPEAKVADEATDKLSLYNQAAKDSAAKAQAAGMDPFAASDSMLPGYGDTAVLAQQSYNTYPPAAANDGPYGNYPDPNEAKVRDRLASLERALSDPSEGQDDSGEPVSDASNTSMSADMQKLEEMMSSVTASGGKDEEISQLSELMEKVLDVQYPQRAQQKLKERSAKNKGRVFSVAPRQDRTQAGLMAMPTISDRARIVDSMGTVPVFEPTGTSNGFYSLGNPDNADTQQTAVPAVVHETQTLLTGSTVKMRLTEDIMVNGLLIPSGTFVYGNCSINGERLQIEIPGIRYGKHLFPVSLTVFDLDGLAGVRVPGAISRDVAKDGAGEVVGSMQFMSLDPSLASQAAGAGVEVAKGLFNKKTKLIRVTVKAGYPVLLMDDKARQDMN